MKKIIPILVAVIVGIVAIFLALFGTSEKPTDESFTFEEWAELAEIYDREIKEMGGLQFKNVSGFGDVDKRLDAIMLERAKDKDKEYRKRIEYLINKKHANSRKN